MRTTNAADLVSTAVENRRPIVYPAGMTASGLTAKAIAQFCRKYMWWKPLDGQPYADDRIIAQAMNLGTYDDILLLEQAIGRTHLVEVMRAAEPGWFSDRSWEFWRGRLAFATGAAIPDHAPRRVLDAALP